MCVSRWGACVSDRHETVERRTPFPSSTEMDGTLSLQRELLRLNNHFRQRLHTLGVTPLQVGVILYIYRHKRVNLMDIAEALGVHESTIDLLVRGLLRKGLVERQTRSKGTASKHFLTASAERLVPNMTEAIKDLSEQIREASLHA